MKKTLLMLAGGLLMSMSALAQEEDVTHYIQNAGFDEDLTFQTDGATKEIVETSHEFSSRSYAYVAADSTVYAYGRGKRSDGYAPAWNGFYGHIKGWTIGDKSYTGKEYYPKGKDAVEWVYFGTVPYDIAATAVPIADDGSTFLAAPQKPEAYNTDDNVGFMYLRAGWGGSATYKQVVKLPCAVYRLEYWTINSNASAKNGKNMTRVVCRKDVFTEGSDEEAKASMLKTEWTKHEIEFTPTAEFTVEFGFQAEGGSNSNPFLCIDGIKLFKVGEADPIKLLESDIQDVASECAELAGSAAAAGYNGLAGWIGDYGYQVEELMNEEQAGMEEGLKKANAYMVTLRKAVDEMPNVDAILAKMDGLLQTTDYAGKAAFEEAYQKILGYKEEGVEDVDNAELILNAVSESKEAIKAYYMTQEASVDSPADFTILLQSPWFINESAEPVNEDGVWVFPNQYKEDGTDNYIEGDVNSPDLNSTGWYVAGITAGDHRLNWQRGRSCWNAWNNNFTGTVAVAQDIEGLPNGYYTVSADLITQSGCLNDQHVFAKSIAGKSISSSLTSEGWDYLEWETVSMTAEQKVLVVDGKLTIGAEGTGTGSGATGWFLATNFHLYYLGAAPAEAVEEALNAKKQAANELAAKMYFKADQKTLNDSIAKYAEETDMVKALTGLTNAMTAAETSQAKYEEYIPADGSTEGKTIPTVRETLKRNGGDGYADAEQIVEFAYDTVMNWAAGDTASYKYFDAQVDQLKTYLNTYTPVYNNAAQVAAVSGAAGKAAIEAVMSEQKAALIQEIKDKATVNEYVAKLKEITALVQKQNIFDDPAATDYTAYIENPKAEAETGWEFDKGNGNTNTNSGQWYDGSSTRYFDSYNAEGLKGYIAQQLIGDLPNGTYTVGVYTRTPAEGAFVFCAPAEEKTWLEIPVNYHNDFTEAGEDTTIVASDQYGPMWEEAKLAVEEGTYTEQQNLIYNANSGKGRGWQHQEMAGIVVTNHQLLIGTAAGSEALGTKEFAGNWYSVGGWTLTLTAMGDNTGWTGPIAAGISDAKKAVKAAEGIYNLMGVKTNGMKRGLNIIVVDGKARKVMVK